MRYSLLSGTYIIDYYTKEAVITDAYDILDAGIINNFSYIIDDREVSFNDFILSAILHG